MKQWTVTYREKSGVKTSVVIEAEDRAGVFAELKQRGINAISITEGAVKAKRKVVSGGVSKGVWGAVAAVVVVALVAVVWMMFLPSEEMSDTVDVKTVKSKVKGEDVKASQQSASIESVNVDGGQTVTNSTVKLTEGTIAEPKARRQLTGAAQIIAEAESKGIRPMFKRESENFLAMYVEPGKPVPPPPISRQLIEDMEKSLKESIVIEAGDDERTVAIKEIVAGMKDELSEYIREGGSIEGYLKELDRRQQSESMEYTEASKAVIEMVNATDGDLTEAHEYYLKVNALLKSRGIRGVPMPLKLRKAGF